MLTKERYMTSLESIADYAYSANIGPNGIDVISRDFYELKKLIEEHFTPQPLKFEDLKEGMWIYDAPYEEIVRIKEIESNEWIFLECIKSNDLSNTFFQEGRFYPITIPNIRNKNG